MTRRAAALLLALLIAPAAGAAATIEVQGHRGARGLAPENTLPAFAKAVELGVDVIELDTGMTKDGVLVVAHDPELNPALTRDPNGAWLPGKGPRLIDLTLAELRRYDVGRLNPTHRYGGRYPRQQGADGVRVPTLSEAIAIANTGPFPPMRLNVETKLSPLRPDDTPDPETFAMALIKVLRDHSVTTRTTVQSFDWRTLQVVQREEPRLKTVYLTAEQRWLDNVQRGKPGPSPWTAGFDVDEHGGSVPRTIKAAGGAVWSPFFGDLTADALEEAHELGLKVVVWTVNEEADMRRMADMGVDGIISDYPDVLLKVLGR